MRLLRDTHASIWCLVDNPRLPPLARERIAEPADEILASAASAPDAGRPVADVHHPPGFAEADWNWDETHLDPWLANPQPVFTGAMMPYRQGKAEVRMTIIGDPKDLH